MLCDRGLTPRMSRVLAIAIVCALTPGCDAAMNAGINLGSQVIIEGLGVAFRSNQTAPRATGTSKLVCDVPPGVEHPDPTMYCRSEESSQ